MCRILLSLVLMLALATQCLGKKNEKNAKSGDFQTGKLLDITADERINEGTSYRYVIFTVQVADVVYRTQGGRIRRHSGDVGQGLIVGDAVKVAIDGGELRLLRPDGKEMKTKIIKRTRAQ